MYSHMYTLHTIPCVWNQGSLEDHWMRFTCFTAPSSPDAGSPEFSCFSAHLSCWDFFGPGSSVVMELRIWESVNGRFTKSFMRSIGIIH